MRSRMERLVCRRHLHRSKRLMGSNDCGPQPTPSNLTDHGPVSTFAGFIRMAADRIADRRWSALAIDGSGVRSIPITPGPCQPNVAAAFNTPGVCKGRPTRLIGTERPRDGRHFEPRRRVRCIFLPAQPQLILGIAARRRKKNCVHSRERIRARIGCCQRKEIRFPGFPDRWPNSTRGHRHGLSKHGRRAHRATAT